MVAPLSCAFVRAKIMSILNPFYFMFGNWGRGMARIRVKIEHEYQNWRSPYIEKSGFGLYGLGLPLLGFRVNKQYLVIEFLGLRMRVIWTSQLKPKP